MNVSELIELLSEMDPEAEVRLAQQPSWAMEYAVGRVAQTEQSRVVRREAFEELSEDQQQEVLQEADEGTVVLLDEGESEPEGTVVYIGEGSFVGYLSGAGRAALDWGR